MSTERTFDSGNAINDDATIRPEGLDGTIRPAELDGTIQPTELDGTIRPATLDGTIRPADMTGSQDVSETFRADGIKSHQETVYDDDFILKGINYHKIQCLSDNSGEAQVFLVERNHEEFVLKIYYPSFDVNKKILKTVLNFDFEMIVHVYDYGKTYVDGKHRYYELMEYLRGGTIAEYKLNGDLDRFRRIALQGAAALAYCH